MAPRLAFVLAALSGSDVDASKSQAFITRHCVRATANDHILEKYSGEKLPDWGVPKNWCTERGAEIMRRTGGALVKQFGLDARNTRFYSDNIMRDGLTAQMMIEGMGSQRGNVVFDDILFSTVKPEIGEPLCEMPPMELVKAEREQRFKEMPLPGDFEKDLEEMQQIIGVGPAGRMSEAGGLELDKNGKPAGAVNLLAMFGQELLYAYASEKPYGINVTDEQVNKFISWHFWKRSVSAFNSQIVTDNVMLLDSILTNLALHGSDIYAGHDGNIDGIAALLELTWTAPPYIGFEICPTPPGSGLWFEYDHDSGKVDISYIYRAFNTTESNDEFTLSQSHVKSWDSMKSLKSYLNKRLGAFQGARECMSKAAPDNRKCESHPGCMHLHPDHGFCCPGREGVMLACCNSTAVTV